MVYINLASNPTLLLLRPITNSTLDVYIAPCNPRALREVRVALHDHKLARRRNIISVGQLKMPHVLFKKSFGIIKLPRRFNIMFSLPKEMQSFASLLSSVFNPSPTVPRSFVTRKLGILRTSRSARIRTRRVRFAPEHNVIRITQDNRIQRMSDGTAHGLSPASAQELCRQMRDTRDKALSQLANVLEEGHIYKINVMVRRPGEHSVAVQTLRVQAIRTVGPSRAIRH